ncbi:MAG: MMPL family transporter [Fibrobacteria bacterium]
MKTKEKAGLWNRLVRSYVTLSYKRPWQPLLLLALSCGGAVYLAKKLNIDTDLRVLLPKDSPSVVALQEAEKRMGSTDLFTIAFQANSPEAVGAIQKAVADSLSKWKEVVWVQYDQDRSFFEKHALLYLPTDQLKDLHGRISGMVGEDFAKANPLIESLDDEDAPKPSLKGWPDPESLRRQGLPKDLVDALLSKLQARGDDSSKSAAADAAVGVMTAGNPDVKPAPKDPPRPDSLKSRLMGWQESKQLWVGVVLAQMNKPSTDAIFAKGIFERGTAMLEDMQPKGFAKDMYAAVVGAYRNFDEINQVGGDVVTAGIISFVLMFLLLWFFVRKIANVFLVQIPLFVAMAWTTAMTYLIYQRLTILTAFILTLIFGLGIEYTVHLYSRWAEENRKGLNTLDAMIAAVQSTGRSLLAGAATNIFAMLSLQLGHFKGFKEFGIVVSMGITFAMITTWLVMPPLFFQAVKIGDWLLAKVHGRVPRAVVSFFMPSSKVQGGLLLPEMRISPRTLKIMALGAAIFTLGIAFAPATHFENDFANLRGKSTTTGISYGRAVGGGRNTSPSVILGKSQEQMRSVHDSLASRYGNPADSMMQSFATIQSFVPSAREQENRLAEMAEITKLLDARAFDRVDSSTRADLELLRRYLNPGSFDFDSLPAWAQRFLSEADGRKGEFGYLYGELAESDALESGKFQDRFGVLPSSEGKVMVASSGFLYADVVRMVKNDGVRLAVVTFLFLILITWLDMRNWRGVVISCGFVALSSFWTYKIMGLFGLKLGMFNLVVLPTILSVSVDSVIHLYHRRRELGAGKIGELYRTTGSAVLTGTLNNAFGFLGLCFVSHKGVQTIGFMATLGIGSGLVVMFTILPWLLEVLCPKEPVAE